MSWETRARGGHYYTRSRKVNGRVVREYVGCGPEAEQVAASDAERTAKREAERAVVRAERERVQAIDTEFANLHRTVDLLTRGALLAAGFEHHKRQWRKRRDDICEHTASQR